MQLAITGADLVTSVGEGREANFRAFCRGETGNKALLGFDAARFRAKRAYEIDDRDGGGPDVKGRASRWLCGSVGRALREAGLDPADERVPVLVGTGLRELRSLELWWVEETPLHVSELHFAGALQQAVGVGGPIFTFSNACSASSFALGLGADMLRLKEAEAVIVAGCDSIAESMYGALDRVSLVPAEQVQPFDLHRKGVLLGEGAAAVVLEPWERAVARGWTPLASLRGVGMNCDAFHETGPSLEGIVASMLDAHQRAAVRPEEIGLIMAHGTGTRLNDATEALAIKRVFGASAAGVMISGLKSLTGHTSGASGLMSVIVALEAMRQGRVPPTVGFTQPVPEAEELDIVAGSPRAAKVQIAQINAFGFGGVNAVAVVEGAAA